MNTQNFGYTCKRRTRTGLLAYIQLNAIDSVFPTDNLHTVCFIDVRDTHNYAHIKWGVVRFIVIWRLPNTKDEYIVDNVDVEPDDGDDDEDDK